MTKSLLYAREYSINDKISIAIPTMDQILKNEDQYFDIITGITATPSDFMVQLDDLGIDFTSISSFELFLLLFESIKTMDTSLVFGNLNLANFKTAINNQNGLVFLLDEQNDIAIDRAIHNQICHFLCKINNFEKHNRKPANKEAKKYMLERARTKQRRAANKPTESHLEDLIIAMVNTEQYKYNYEDTLKLTIYQFNSSVRQIIKKINYDNTMIGCYTGSINIKDIDQSSLNWLSSK